jgi:hypothetical protein
MPGGAGDAGFSGDTPAAPESDSTNLMREDFPEDGCGGLVCYHEWDG